MIGEIIEWLLGDKSMDKLLHRNVKVQSGVIVLLVAGTVYLTILFVHARWQWINIKNTVSEVKVEQGQTPIIVSNAVTGAIAPLKRELKRDEDNDNQFQAKDALYWRKVDRVLDYINDKDGKQLDYQDPKMPLTNILTSVNVAATGDGQFDDQFGSSNADSSSSVLKSPSE